MSARPGIAKLLRAPWNFEMDYDGVSGDTPILFTGPANPTRPAPGVPDVITGLDPEALQNPPPAGVSPLLARMMPVPIGSTMLFLFPIVQDGNNGAQTGPAWVYVWRAVFRFRTLGDFIRRKRHRVGWTIPLTRFGAQDTRGGHPPNRTTPVAGARVVRPACSEAIVYNRSAPVPSESSPYFGLLASDAVRIPYTTDFVTKVPLYPGASTDQTVGVIRTMDYEQGERDPLSIPATISNPRLGPSHLPKFLKCVGNEVAVECFKYEVDRATGAIMGARAWDFGVSPMTHRPTPGTEDFDFSVLLGIGALSTGDPETPNVIPTPPSDTGVRIISGDFPQ